MNLIGISGLEQSMPFKRRHWPGLDEREYRMSQGHDAAAALIVDGSCVCAAAEERFNRKKHSSDFPIHAIQYCLAEAGLDLADIDEIVHGFDYGPYKGVYSLDPIAAERYRQVYSREALLSLVDRYLPGFPESRVTQVDHHLTHAASAYFTSGWDECLVIVADGMGEVHGVSVYIARNGKLEPIKKVPASDSIGILYSLITFHLGFDFNADEYKIMGLAPYGDPERFQPFFRKIITLCDNGSIRIPILRLNRTREEQEQYLATRQFLSRSLVAERHPDDDILDVHRDVASALQDALDRTLLYLCGYFGSVTGLRKLALAGGVALNCTANGKILRSKYFDEIYVQPAAGDDGSALGAALYRSAQLGSIRNIRQATPFLGPGHGLPEIRAALKTFSSSIDVVEFSDLQEAAREAARLIAASSVIAWYRGRMEFGPRALGHRSILADPGHPQMRDRINAMVKMREAFRPFAPAVTIDEVHRWFEVEAGTELPFMIMNVDVREEHRSALPAITHVNGSARVQTVAAHDNCEFYQLLKEVGRQTGREMVLNTSFNVKGQPIVNTPQEAIETYLRTGIDYLFVENFLVRRKTQSRC
jgi:carbamoyltransferase